VGGSHQFPGCDPQSVVGHSWYAWITAAGRRPACLTSMPRCLAQARIVSAWPRGAMFEVGFIERVDFVPLRAAAFSAGAFF
jgi:hypothetical protein